MGFRSLQHMRNRRSTGRGRCLPATFRLQGLVTLLTVFSLRSRAGSVSHRQRSWDLPFGALPSREVSERYRSDGPTCRLPCGVAPRRNGEPGPQAAVSGLRPSRKPLTTRRVVSTPSVRCSLGLGLSRARTRRPGSGFRPTSSLALCRAGGEPTGLAGAPEYRSAAAWLYSAPRT
jgi:hypothetical protein